MIVNPVKDEFAVSPSFKPRSQRHIAAPRLEQGRRKVWQFLLGGAVGQRPPSRGKAEGDHGHPLGPRQQPPSHWLRNENSECSADRFEMTPNFGKSVDIEFVLFKSRHPTDMLNTQGCESSL